MIPPDFKNDPRGKSAPAASPLFERIHFVFLALSDLDGFIMFRLD